MNAKLDREAHAAIDAALAEAVYDAIRVAQRQRAGQAPVPKPSGRAWDILARSRDLLVQLREVDTT